MSADEQLPPHEWLPWQEDAFKTAGINIDEVHEVDDEDDDSRKRITWIYSIEGDVGKSSFSSCLQEQCGALVIALGSKVADLKHAIFSHKEKLDKWERPIIIADLSRTESRMLDRAEIYVALEAVSGNFHSTKYEGGVVTWEQPPTLIVFANQPPKTEWLSPDRFQVYIITHELTLLRDTLIDDALEKYRLKLLADQQTREQDIASGPATDPNAFLVAQFGTLFCVTTGAPAIKSSKMHWMLRRGGYRGSCKDLNAWLRGHFAVDIQAGRVKETRPQNIVCWKGFTAQ